MHHSVHFRFALALLPALLLAACSGSEAPAPADDTRPVAPAPGAVAGSTEVEAAVEDAPCTLLTPEIVAAVFDVPVSGLERAHSMSSKCAYSWEGGERTLQASLDVSGVYEDAESAARRFRSATRGMSSEALDDAMQDVAAKAREELHGAGAKRAADAVAGTPGSADGIVFEDVRGVGDEARMAQTVGAGDLHVRAGNLNFVVAAYSGPAMPSPDSFDPGAIMAASNAWRTQTLPERERAATELARAVVASL